MDSEIQENKVDIIQIKINGVIKELKDEIKQRLWLIQRHSEKAYYNDYKDLEKELNYINNLLDECSELALELKIYNQRL